MANKNPTGKGASSTAKGDKQAQKSAAEIKEELLRGQKASGKGAETEEDPRFARFLHAYARYPHKGAALQTAGLTQEDLLAKMRDDSNFSRRFLEADEMGTDALEDAAVERAVKGWLEPVFNMKLGIEIGEIRKYSDTLLVLLLKGRRKKYRGEDQTAGRGVSEEARREMKELFNEAEALIKQDLQALEVTPVSVNVTVGKAAR